MDVERVQQRLRAAMDEIARRKAVLSTYAAPDMSRDLFDKQLQVWWDKSRIKALLCGRRAGKSEFASRWLIDGALTVAGSLNLYITLTRKNAKLIVWPKLKKACRGLRCKFNEAELTISFPNGSVILLGGCDNASEVEKYRGPAYFRVVVDECGSFPPYLETLYSDVLEPAMLDFQGEVLFCGTPGVAWDGFWFEMTGPTATFNIPVYHWTVFDNPHIPHATRDVAEIRKRRGWAEDNPTYEREYKGKWSKDPEGLVMPWLLERNQVDALPEPEGWRFVLGIDVGYVDACAFALWAAHRNYEDDFLLETRTEAGLLSGEVAEIIRQYQDRCKAMGGSLSIVMDTGGMGKVHAEECRRRFGIPVEAAEKSEKESAIRIQRDRIRSGRIKTLAGKCNDAIRHEWAVLRWNDDKTDFADGQTDHTAHAALYGHRKLRHYLYKPKSAAPSPGTLEWMRQEAERMRQDALKRANKQRPKGLPGWDR